MRPLRKSTLAASFLIQAAFVFAAAALAQTRAVAEFGQSSLDTDSVPNAELVAAESIAVLAPIMLLAFQFGGQIVMSRALGFNEVPTSVLTSLYCDLWSDPKLFDPWSRNPKRNRRLKAIVLFFVGGIAGGWLQRTAGGMSCVLWIAGSVKLAMAVGWTTWKSKQAAKS